LQCLNQAATSSGDTQSRAVDAASINASSLLALNLHKTPNAVNLKIGWWLKAKQHLILKTHNLKFI